MRANARQPVKTEMRGSVTLSRMLGCRLRVGGRLFLPCFVVMALALWLAFETCAFAQPSPAKPEVKSFKLGALEVSVLHDDSLAIPNDGSIFGLNAGGAAAVAKVLSEAGAPTNKVQLDVDALLIRMPGHLVLVDAGYGPSGHGIVQSSLALTGVSPADITDILVTHAHPDHVGGLVDAQGRSAFPKATIRMSAKEWAFMQREDGVRAEVPIIRAQVKTFQPGRPILTGVTPLALPGHTPGHVGYEIASQGHKLIDIGDVAHSSIVSLAKPRWTIAWDSNKQEGVQTRRQELRRLADTHELMFAPHFPFPGVGRIEKAGDGYRFQPEMPSSK